MKRYKRYLLLVLVFLISSPVYAQATNICFNLYIVTKQSKEKSEQNIFAEQKRALLNQIERTEQVFLDNKKQQCPTIKTKAGRIKHIQWQEAKTYSQPLDQEVNESDKDYAQRKKQEIISELLALETELNNTPDINKHDFLKKRPAKLLLRAEKWGANDEHIQSAIKTISDKLTVIDPEGEVIKREKAISNKYESIDRASAETWKEGILTLWNDIEAQDVSIETKNLLRFNRTAENQCIDVYSVPKGHSPSRNNKETQNNGEWSQRGGAALSSELFPLTTAGKGHAIIMTQDIRSNEYRLAHEIGHILISARNAHLGKEPKDLMYEKSMGGYFLNEEECEKINQSLEKD